MNKAFTFYLLQPKEDEHFVVLKCDLDKTVESSEKYQSVTDGVYTSATLTWNSVQIGRDMSDSLLAELIEHFAERVIKKLPKRDRKNTG